MTVSEATNKLVDFFAKNDCYEYDSSETPKDDFKHLITVSESPEKERKAVLAALIELEKINIVKLIEERGKRFYVLTKPLAALDQTISINIRLAMEIAETVNAFCDAVDNKAEIVDVTNIQPKDIQTLIFLANLPDPKEAEDDEEE